MKKNLYTTLLAFALFANVGFAQTFEWAKGFGGTGNDTQTDFAVANDGSTYIIGYYTGSLTSGSNTINAVGWNDIFVAKHKPNGDNDWLKSFGGANNDRGFGLTIDNAGSVYITGFFESGAIFGSYVPSHYGGTGGDVFVAKLDANTGNVIWVESEGGDNHDVGNSLALDPTNTYLYATGSHSGSASYLGYDLYYPTALDVFVVKYSTLTGAPLLTNAWGGSGNEAGTTIDVDANGDVLLGAEYTASFNFAGDALVNSSANNDVLIAKLKSDLSKIFTKTINGTSSDDISSIIGDPNGNFYAGGNFSGTSNISGSGSLNSGGGVDNYLIKFSATGTVLWASVSGGTGTDCLNDIAVDIVGDVYITGYFNTSATFNLKNVSGTLNEVFVTKYKNNGTALWAISGGSDGTDIAYGIGLDNLGNVYVAGQYNATAMFGSSVLNVTGGVDLFVAKIGGACVPPSLFFQLPASTNANIGDNVTFNLSVTGTDLYYLWNKFGSPLIGEEDSTLTLTSVTSGDAGSYTFTAINACGYVSTSTELILSDPTPAPAPDSKKIVLKVRRL